MSAECAEHPKERAAKLSHVWRDGPLRERSEEQLAHRIRAGFYLSTGTEIDTDRSS